MENLNVSIEKLMKTLYEIPNKEQTIDNLIETLYQNNIMEALRKTDFFIKNEINENQKLLLNIKNMIQKE